MSDFSPKNVNSEALQLAALSSRPHSLNERPETLQQAKMGLRPIETVCIISFKYLKI